MFQNLSTISEMKSSRTALHSVDETPEEVGLRVFVAWLVARANPFDEKEARNADNTHKCTRRCVSETSVVNRRSFGLNYENPD